MEPKYPSTLDLQIRQHLSGLKRDDQLYPKIFGTREDGVPVTLLPFEFECADCRAEGYAPRLVEAFRLGIRVNWCKECRIRSHFRKERRDELNPHLMKFLERRFVVERDQPGTGFVVRGLRAEQDQ